jgi:hypothetical protein
MLLFNDPSMHISYPTVHFCSLALKSSVAFHSLFSQALSCSPVIWFYLSKPVALFHFFLDHKILLLLV